MISQATKIRELKRVRAMLSVLLDEHGPDGGVFTELDSIITNNAPTAFTDQQAKAISKCESDAIAHMPSWIEANQI